MSKVTLGKYLDGKGPLCLDINRLIDTRLLVQSNSGGGKSYLLRKLIEECHGKVQIIVLDIEGEFSTLRSKYDFIVAGKGGDIAAEPRSAELMARKILELRSDLIVDLYELKQYDRIRFVKLFLDSMVNAPKDLWHPVLVILDEAHQFAPEKSKGEALSAVVDMASRGRKRGFCLAVATQRPAKLDKDVAAECQNKLIGLANTDLDRERGAKELGFTHKDLILSMRDLEPGEFYAVGPAFGKGVHKVKIGEVHTTHPHSGSGRIKVHAPAPTAKVKQVLAKLADLPKQAEEELRDRTALTQKVHELERELRTAKREAKVETKIETVVDQRAIDRAIKATKAEMLKALHEQLSGFSKATIEHLKSLQPAPRFHAPTERAKPAAAAQKPARAPVIREDGDDRPMGRSERKILKFLAMREGKSFTKQQIGALTGFAHRGGSFNTYLSRLRSAGLVEAVGRDQFQVADPARAQEALGDEYHAPDVASLEHWLTELGGGAKQIYQTLLEHPDQEFSKDDLGGAVGMEPKGGSFNTYISRLCALGLAERANGGIRLNQELMNL
jgi:hypothetical protein